MTKSAQGSLGPCLPYHFSCQGEVQGTCVHNKTTYFICQQNDKQSCFLTPLPPISEDWLEVRHQKEGILINQTLIENEDLPVSVYFDACAAIGKNPKGVTNCGSLSWERTYTNNDKYVSVSISRSSCYGDPGFTALTGAVSRVGNLGI